MDRPKNKLFVLEVVIKSQENRKVGKFPVLSFHFLPHPFRTGVYKLRPAGQLWPAFHFLLARGKFQKYI